MGQSMGQPIGSSKQQQQHNQTKCKTSASCGTLKEECQSPNVKKRRKSANSSAKSAASLIHESDSTSAAAAGIISNSDQSLPEKEEYKIQLKKDTNGLGITIAGYVCEKGIHTSALRVWVDVNSFFRFFEL